MIIRIGSRRIFSGRIISLLTVCIFIGLASPSRGQQLRPGFDANEYLQLLEIFQQQASADSAYPGVKHTIPAPEHCHLLYRSKETVLFNRWELWLREDSVAVISIRGTIPKAASWLENFYAAMVPATGTLQLNDSTSFYYKLAEDSSALVHIGWLIGMASMTPDIMKHLKNCVALGIHDFIIAGHSQGAGIAFLLRSYLHYLPDSILSKELYFKTYCSAAPKPGNLYYAYDFDYLNRGGWGLRVVNTLDWVPESPVAVQTVKDMNPVNPFGNIKSALKKQSFFVRLYGGHVYRQLNGSTRKAMKRMKKYLGHVAYKQIRKELPQLREPVYAPSDAYTPAGTAIVLPPYPGYDEEFPYDGKNVFIHHGLKPYYELVLHDYKETITN